MSDLHAPGPPRADHRPPKTPHHRRRIATALAAAAAAAAGALAFAVTPASAAANTDRLNPNEQLNPGERLISPNGKFVLTMQGDGNLVEYAPGNRPVWASGTSSGGSIARMQGDGNLVVIAVGNLAVWATGTSGNPNADLELQSDGNIVVYAQGHIARWASGTQVGPTALSDRIIATANNEAGNPSHNRETATNCNFYSGQLGAGTACGGGPGWRAEEWCADFARWVWGQAGVNTSGLNAGAISFQSTTASRTWHAGSTLTGVQPGDVVGYNFGGSMTDDHVGVVVVVGASSMTTVEGNYSDAVTTRTVARNSSGLSGYSHPTG
jgi:hypothetical protein